MGGFSPTNDGDIDHSRDGAATEANAATDVVTEIEDGMRAHDDTEVEDDDGEFVMTQLEGL